MCEYIERRLYKLNMLLCCCVTAWAKVEVQVEESVEAYLGDPAQIPCLYSFTDVESEPRFVMIQWFVVSQQ